MGDIIVRRSRIEVDEVLQPPKSFERLTVSQPPYKSFNVKSIIAVN